MRSRRHSRLGDLGWVDRVNCFNLGGLVAYVVRDTSSALELCRNRGPYQLIVGELASATKHLDSIARVATDISGPVRQFIEYIDSVIEMTRGATETDEDRGNLAAYLAQITETAKSMGQRSKRLCT